MNHQQFEDAIALANDPRLRHATRSSLLGYIALRAGAPKRARQYFVEVLRADPDRALIWTYLAMAHYRLGDLERADKALERVTTPEGKTPEYWALRARLAREQDSAPQAFELLLGALKQFNQSAQLLREAAYVLLAHSAVYAARPFAEAFLWRSPPSQSWRETARWIETLIQLEHLGEAIAQLEIARWRFPEHASEILGRQAYLYASRGWASTAARLFAQASSRDPGSFAFEAADQFRISQKTNDALIWNIHVKKTAQRLPQRLLILIEDERWARAAALAPQLAKAGLMGDTTRYQLGVAFLHSGDLARAQEQAQRIADQQFKTRLLELIASCEAQIAAGGGLWCW